MINTNIARRLTLSVFLTVSLCACQSQAKKEIQAGLTATPPKNVILMIGDGMGLTQISAAAQDQSSALNLERASYVGLSKTSSSKQEITDSAAGATAFAIGEKTFNGAIGVDADGVSKVTILEMLAAKGHATGLIATSTITHATPASFFAHVDSRQKYYEIAEQMVNAPVSLFIGGGKKHFYNRTDQNVGPADERNLIDEMTAIGVTFADDVAALESIDGRAAIFTAESHPKPVAKGRGDMLAKSIAPAVAFLQKQSDTGFFLMIEGSQIDWGGHENNYKYAMSELIDFDNALAEVLKFAEQDGNTLVVVTADHETGGLSLPKTDVDEGQDGYVKASEHFSTNGHTSTMVPVFAFGKGAEHFSGVYENTAIYHRMLEALLLK